MINQKFNATHLFERFDILPKDMNNLKRKFNQVMFGSDQEKYHDWVEAN